MTGPLVRRGMLIPLVAVCLALTLLSGTLLTVVAGRQHSAAATPTTPSTRSVTAARPLPDAAVTLDGKQVPLRKLVPAVLAWVPEYCSCIAALKQLTRQAAQAHVRMYLVGPARETLSLPGLALQVGQHRGNVVNDPTDALARAYSPMGLTAILAKRDGTVRAVIRQLQATNSKIATVLPALAGPSHMAGVGTPSAATLRPSPQAT